MRRVVLSATVAAGLLGRVDEARAAEDDGDSAAMSANRGLKVGLAPTLLLPQRDGGPYGGGVALDARYGIEAGPTVLAPGGRIGGYLQSARFIGVAMPTFRVTLPVGPFAPFVMGGVGGGLITNASQGGVALLAGGGLMIHFGRVFAVGAEVTYQIITNTDFHTLAIGPSISFGG